MVEIKITIDTKEDSAEEIKKAIKLLSSLIEGPQGSENRNIFNAQELPKENVLGGMFEASSAKIDKTDEKPDIEQEIPRMIEYS